MVYVYNNDMCNLKKNVQLSGFTLIEILLTVSILAILMATIIGNFGPARESARDSQRQTDLRTVEAALALYKNKYGVYPAGCNLPTTGNTVIWSGELGTDHSCDDGTSNYIRDLAPEFIPKLPTDPRLNGPDSGYVYTTNSDRTVYKFMALKTVETETIDLTSKWYRCDDSYDAPLAPYTMSYDDVRICRNTPISANQNAATPPRRPECSNASEFATTYAVSGGFSSNSRGGSDAERGMEYDTEIVRCG